MSYDRISNILLENWILVTARPEELNPKFLARVEQIPAGRSLRELRLGRTVIPPQTWVRVTSTHGDDAILPFADAAGQARLRYKYLQAWLIPMATEGRAHLRTDTGTWRWELVPSPELTPTPLPKRERNYA